MCFSTKDLWRFVRIHWIRENRPNLWKLTGFMINDSKRIFLSQDLWSMIGYKSSVCIVRHGSNIFGVRICDHNTIWIHGFAKWIHVFTNLLYNSRILNLKICAFYIKLPSLYTFTKLTQVFEQIWWISAYKWPKKK